MSVEVDQRRNVVGLISRPQRASEKWFNLTALLEMHGPEVEAASPTDLDDEDYVVDLRNAMSYIRIYRQRGRHRD